MGQSSNRGVSLSKHRQAFPNHGGEISPRLKYLMRLIGEGKFNWFTWKQQAAYEEARVNKMRAEAWLRNHKKKLKDRRHD